KAAWWDDMIAHHDDTVAPQGAPSPLSMVGLDSSILMNPRVWEASGHVGGFADPMVACMETRARYRADQLVVFRLLFDGEAVDAPLFASPGEWDKSTEEELTEPHKKRIASIARAQRGKSMRVEAVGGALED